MSMNIRIAAAALAAFSLAASATTALAGWTAGADAQCRHWALGPPCSYYSPAVATSGTAGASLHASGLPTPNAGDIRVPVGDGSQFKVYDSSRRFRFTASASSLGATGGATPSTKFPKIPSKEGAT